MPIISDNMPVLVDTHEQEIKAINKKIEDTGDELQREMFDISDRLTTTKVSRSEFELLRQIVDHELDDLRHDIFVLKIRNASLTVTLSIVILYSILKAFGLI